MANYWEDATLALSVPKGKARTAAPAGPAVSQLQADLVALGYLDKAAAGGKYDARTGRAVLRFQRHAARPYRMPQPDAGGADLFTGASTGTCDHATAQEIQKWKEKKWTLPLNRFLLTALSVPGGRGELRSDAAAAWGQIMTLVQTKGGTLNGPYGDTHRGVRPTAKLGASRYSFHYCGRAVDISGALASPPAQRYYICKEPIGGDMYWRIHCKTEKQDGSQGVLIRKKTTKWFYHGSGSEAHIPEGYYLDLTAAIESTGKFERIKAQAGWQGVYAKMEWWHFQYKADKQPTFLDEMELIGYGEAKLRACGWASDESLDHPPG